MMERTIRVTGKGKLSVKPDMIRLRINIEGMYEEYDETLRRSSDCVEILKDLIEKLGYERKEHLHLVTHQIAKPITQG